MGWYGGVCSVCIYDHVLAGNVPHQNRRATSARYHEAITQDMVLCESSLKNVLKFSKPSRYLKQLFLAGSIFNCLIAANFSSRSSTVHEESQSIYNSDDESESRSQYLHESPYENVELRAATGRMLSVHSCRNDIQ